MISLFNSIRQSLSACTPGESATELGPAVSSRGKSGTSPPQSTLQPVMRDRSSAGSTLECKPEEDAIAPNNELLSLTAPAKFKPQFSRWSLRISRRKQGHRQAYRCLSKNGHNCLLEMRLVPKPAAPCIFVKSFIVGASIQVSCFDKLL